MDDEHKKALSIFYPELIQKLTEAEENNFQLVQYTSADAAMHIITNNEVWLRNTKCMNDYREVEHGISCLLEAYKSDDIGYHFKLAIDTLFPDLRINVENLFDGWLPHLRSNTFIACVSEHLPAEDEYGRLSMWRAYGGNSPVAIVMNSASFRAESDVFNAYTHPVVYRDTRQFKSEFGALTKRLLNEASFLQSMGPEKVEYYLFEMFKTSVLCIKHPGFAEEREWRIVYNPVLAASEHVKSKIVSINNVPQEIQVIPLRDFPDEGLIGITIPDLIDKIIIGPAEHQLTLGQTFIKLLTEAGCKNPQERIRYSGIPIRHKK